MTFYEFEEMLNSNVSLDLLLGIEYAMEHKTKTIKELAETCGVTRQTMRKHLDNPAMIDEDETQRLEQALSDEIRAARASFDSHMDNVAAAARQALDVMRERSKSDPDVLFMLFDHLEERKQDLLLDLILEFLRDGKSTEKNKKA